MVFWLISLIVLFYDNGCLVGWMGLGVWDDGWLYDVVDCV